MEMEEILELLKNPETLGALHNLIEVYKTPVYSLIGEIVNIWKDFIDSEYYNLNASSQKRMYDAYVNAGFSEEQAMMLLLNNNLETAKFVRQTSVKLNNSNRE